MARTRFGFRCAAVLSIASTPSAKGSAVIPYTLDESTLPRQVDPRSPNHPLLIEEGGDRMR